MAVPEYIELTESGSGERTLNDDGTQTRDVSLKYLVSGKPGYLEAEQWGLQKAPLVYRGHRRKKLACAALGNGWWHVTADYTNAAIQSDEQSDNQDSNSSQPEGNTVAFDTTGGTEHVTTAYSDSQGGPVEGAFYNDAADYVDHYGIIDMDGDTVRGTDKVVPSFQFTETWVFPSKYLIDTYISTLYTLTGTVNKSRFRVFNEAECLFLGARGELTRGSTLASIVFSFSARPTRDNFTVGGGGFAITVDQKKGWDHMAIQYKRVVQGSLVVSRPAVVRTNKLYARTDFSKLSIGTTFPAVYQPAQSFARAT